MFSFNFLREKLARGYLEMYPFAHAFKPCVGFLRVAAGTHSCRLRNSGSGHCYSAFPENISRKINNDYEFLSGVCIFLTKGEATITQRKLPLSFDKA